MKKNNLIFVDYYFRFFSVECKLNLNWRQTPHGNKALKQSSLERTVTSYGSADRRPQRVTLSSDSDSSWILSTSFSTFFFLSPSVQTTATIFACWIKENSCRILGRSMGTIITGRKHQHCNESLLECSVLRKIASPPPSNREATTGANKMSRCLTFVQILQLK